MTDSKIFRLIVDFFIFASVILFPWWVPLILSLIFVFYFDFYVEFLILSFVLDALYSGISTSFIGRIQFSLFGSISFFVLIWIKERFLIKPKF